MIRLPFTEVIQVPGFLRRHMPSNVIADLVPRSHLSWDTLDTPTAVQHLGVARCCITVFDAGGLGWFDSSPREAACPVLKYSGSAPVRPALFLRVITLEYVQRDPQRTSMN